MFDRASGTRAELPPDLPGLTGSGVAFHLLWAVRQMLGEPAPLEYADLAAIGTIADLAPLLGENRALVKAGLAQMRSSRWTGIRAMLEGAKITVPNAKDVGFVIAPRINAAGRLGEADVALELLTTDSGQRALTLATYLDARNVERKKIQEDMFKDALEVCDRKRRACRHEGRLASGRHGHRRFEVAGTFLLNPCSSSPLARVPCAAPPASAP
ncbi:MAG: hypothetical protein HC933_06775 [Pleurocapsa sp. SU_196_0]|nr:hypothetical protein [Pleurocapsa sp. SU_196_0]